MVLASTLALGGGERVLAKMLQELSAEGRSFHLITLKEPGHVGELLRSEGLSVESWNLAGTRDPRILLRLWRHLRRRGPGMIYIQDHHDCIFWGSLAAALSGFIPVVIPVHSSGQKGATSFRIQSRWLLGLGQVLVLLGRWHHRALRDEDRLVDGPRATIPNPLDSTRFNFMQRSKSEEIVVGTVAALRPEKRHDLLLKLFAELNSLRPSRLRIAGEGPEQKILEKLADGLGIRSQVEFLGSREDVAEVLASFDLFLLTSEVEAQPLSLIEALACGVAVAAPARGGIPEILEGGHRGLILQGEDAANWGRQVADYLDHLPDESTRRQRADDIREEFSDKSFTKRYARLMDLLMGTA
ncbi:glycosyltransferase [bacterium]|nr:glycosyltransferase [bacterium]